MKKWPWKLYGVFLTSLVSHDILTLLSAESPFRSYYTILIAFNKFYFIPLVLNIIAIVLNMWVVLVVFYYAFDIKNSLRFWKTLFFVRILFDLTGHFYELQFIKASFFQSFSYGLACIGVFVIPAIASYIAHYLYAFRKNEPEQA